MASLQTKPAGPGGRAAGQSPIAPVLRPAKLGDAATSQPTALSEGAPKQRLKTRAVDVVELPRAIPTKVGSFDPALTELVGTVAARQLRLTKLLPAEGLVASVAKPVLLKQPPQRPVARRLARLELAAPEGSRTRARAKNAVRSLGRTVKPPATAPLVLARPSSPKCVRGSSPPPPALGTPSRDAKQLPGFMAGAPTHALAGAVEAAATRAGRASQPPGTARQRGSHVKGSAEPLGSPVGAFCRTVALLRSPGLTGRRGCSSALPAPAGSGASAPEAREGRLRRSANTGQPARRPGRIPAPSYSRHKRR